MDRKVTNCFACSVCGVEVRRHTGWFLVAENQWLDHIKILSWHPVLARQVAMRSVCCPGHLKILLSHWLTHANLQFLAAGAAPWTQPDQDSSCEGDAVTLSLGGLVGELAVHRESLSRAWTGSAESLECILNALISGVSNLHLPSAAPVNPVPQPSLRYASSAGSGD